MAFWNRASRLEDKPAQRLSRREREQRNRRILLTAMAALTVLIGALLVGGAIYEFVWRPRESLAQVGPVTITRGDYWKVRKYTLGTQIQTYQNFAAQNPQYQSYVTQLQQQLPTVKSGPVDPTTLGQMIDDQVVQQRLGDLGLTVTDADIAGYTQTNFAPVPLTSPTPSPTVNPTAEAWADETATAQARTPTPRATPGTPGAATPEVRGTPATPATPATAATPATPGTASPVPGSPAATPMPAATPNREEALATANARYSDFLKGLDSFAQMSREDFVRLVARPTIARQLVTEKLQAQITDVAPQVHAFHILAATKDGAALARKLVVEDGQDFATVARDKSTDTSTAPNGGDLGWFPKGVMVPAFEDVAFALEPGQVSDPVQTKFGWHIIKVVAKDPARPLTVPMLKQLKDGAFQKWLDAEKAKVTITSSLAPTPTPPAQQRFQPPPGAPPTPIPTPVPTPPASPGATPGRGSPPAPPTSVP